MITSVLIRNQSLTQKQNNFCETRHCHATSRQVLKQNLKDIIHPQYFFQPEEREHGKGHSLVCVLFLCVQEQIIIIDS